MTYPALYLLIGLGAGVVGAGWLADDEDQAMKFGVLGLFAWPALVICGVFMAVYYFTHRKGKDSKAGA